MIISLPLEIMISFIHNFHTNYMALELLLLCKLNCNKYRFCSFCYSIGLTAKSFAVSVLVWNCFYFAELSKHISAVSDVPVVSLDLRITHSMLAKHVTVIC